jgi:NAD-dependent deacetylase
MSLPGPVRELLRTTAESSGRVVFLTGAGISAESGIPTFRGKEGYWTVGSREYQPQELATRAAFARMPDEVWRWYLYRRTICRRATANAGHRSLVQLEAALGDRFVLVTQNVDGLHLRAGNSLPRTLQIHGNIDYMRYPAPEGPHTIPIPAEVGDKGRDEPLTAAERAALRGPGGEPARPHVLWFDECYDEPRFRADSALRAAATADLLVVVGTAGATNLPLQMAATAARRGVPIIDINVDPDNPFARHAAAHDGGASLIGTASDLLPPLAAALQAG